MFIIAGDGELHDRIKEYANMHGIDVRLVGYKTLNEVNDLMDISDIYFLPSLSDANPLSCVEALWKGMPLLISTHCGNYPEVVCQGHNGYAFNYENEESALIMINNMIECSEDWIECAKGVSLDIAKKKYSTPNTVSRIISEMRIFSNQKGK